MSASLSVRWGPVAYGVDAGLAMQDTDTGFFSRNSDGTAGDPMVRAPGRDDLQRGTPLDCSG